MGDLDEGVIFYDRKANSFTKPFIKELGERNSIAHILYQNGTCYSFSGENILKWNVDSLRLEKIQLPSQMDKPINSIALDSTGHLWIASMNGLLAYNLHTKDSNLFTTSDGLLSNDLSGKLYCNREGKIIYSCPDYLSEFDPNAILASINESPKIQLSEVLVNGIPYHFHTGCTEYFDHNSNNFIFKWSVVDFSNPLHNRYYYQLQGFDKDWRPVGNTGNVEFVNLSSGNYILLLKGENSNGVNAGRILKFYFQIYPPFWRTWWFLGLIFLSIIVFFYALYRYRLNHAFKIERLRNKISLDLHDDIGSTLSSISILSEMALRDLKSDETRDMLGEIKGNSIQMMDKMDDIVWSINPKNDSLEDLFLRIKTFAARLFEAKEVNYKINIDENIKHIPVLMEFRQHIYLILKEAINNLVKYSGCTVAEIEVTYHSSLLKIMIKDNGKGYNTDKLTSGNGLNNMKRRAREINGTIEMKSTINEGTSIQLLVKV